MLKKLTIIIFVTIATFTIAVGYFFLMKELPKQLSALIHNILASLIGIGFISVSEILRKKSKEYNYYFIFLFLIGLAMLAIHLIKIIFSRC